MTDNNLHSRGMWSSRMMFILAAAGSAIGLGNIWKFPYIAGKYGGGAFVLAYLFFILLIGTPILVAEIMIGREARKNPVGAFWKISGKNKLWTMVGFLGVASGFVILSYYSVVAGWTVDYFVKSISGTYMGAGPDKIGELFGSLVSSGPKNMLWHTIFMGLTIGIVIFGVKDGLERWIGILMPVLFIILVFMVFYGLIAGDASQGLKFLFVPEWGNLIYSEVDGVRQLTGRPLMEAMGHAFFTLSLGMGAMITYGSYLGDDENLPTSAIMVAVLDTLIAIMASIAIYTILFKHGLNPTEKATAGLVFQVLPLAFAKMWGGQFIGSAFFLLLSFAALTSAISLLEVVVAYFIDDRKWARRSATLIMGAVTWGLGILSALSYSTLGYIKILDDRKLSILDSLDLIATNYMLPVGGLFIAIFAGYYMTRENAKTQIMKGGGSEGFFNVWNFLIRYVTPVMVCLLFLFKINEHLGIWK